MSGSSNQNNRKFSQLTSLVQNILSHYSNTYQLSLFDLSKVIKIKNAVHDGRIFQDKAKIIIAEATSYRLRW